MKTAAVVLLLFFLSTPSAPAQPQVRVTGLFSNMEFHKESGDVIGTEVFVVFSNGGYRAVVQIAQGEPDVPIVVPATVQGANLSFSLPNHDDLKFVGRVTRSALVGALGEERVSLRRGKSYWQ